jgi:hypothetical protein
MTDYMTDYITPFELTDYLIVWLGLLLFFTRLMKDESFSAQITIPLWVALVAIPYYWGLRLLYINVALNF